MPNSLKNDPVLRAIGIIVLVMLAIGLIFFMFGRPAGIGMYGYGMMDGEGYGMMGGYAAGQGGFYFGNLLFTLFHTLLALSVLGLVVGLAVYLYQLIMKRGNSTAPVVSGTSQSAACAHCNTKLPGDAQFCPSCGTKVNKAE